MTSLVDLRLHHHIAHEIYRQQMLQRLPDPYPTMLPVPPPQRQTMPQRYGLPGANAKLQNADLWSQFHRIGTEMIITKSGRRMFPSLRIALSGLEEDTNYCVLLEMVPIGDCRYKFSGSQWVPAGGAEPQSTQRMYLHPDSPAMGSHWAAQPVLFNKVKLTNNTLDSCGHVVLTSMHKYQPRLHIIRTSDPSQIPWAQQQGFSFPETEFVAVTAYQNDRITKLKIDNNPFAKGFRESGQSRCKRKMTTAQTSSSASSSSSIVDAKEKDEGASIYDENENLSKRKRTNSFTGSMSSLDDSGLSISESSSGTSSPPTTSEDIRVIDEEDHQLRLHLHQQQQLQNHPNQYQQEMILQQFRDSMYPSTANINPWMDLAFSYLSRASSYPQFYGPSLAAPANFADLRTNNFCINPYSVNSLNTGHEREPSGLHSPSSSTERPVSQPASPVQNLSTKPQKKCSFSISSILGCES